MEKADLRLLGRSTEIVSAFVSNNAVRVSDLGALIESVHMSLLQLSGGAPVEAPVVAAEPAVSIRKSVSHDYVYCLEDGKKFKSIRRHLMTAHGLTPEQYRDKWALPPQYPMVAPAYASARSDLAKNSGLGRVNGQRSDVPASSAQPADAAAKKPRGRPRTRPAA
ncbi:MucR family transcriptional regulator [Beijerinckia sp. L45]|uniref:MucR family transcriptional regulator n=1 Tax=Beijerinckia sp. L45 TaxID=1641855 RepID=UPI0027380D8B|nr:MucR family transcriptional regulator [Beijerinckia sp. L45]